MGNENGVWLPDDIEHWERARLRANIRNPRLHSEKQVAKIAASITEFGWTSPLLIDDEGVVIAGHGRLLAAELLGMDTVPVIRLSTLSDDQKRAYGLADNQLALDASWNDELLIEELELLKGADYDLPLVGFEPNELGKYLDRGETEEVPTPEPPDDPVTQPGDLYILGQHRLLCGDASLDSDIDRLLDGAMVHLIDTDPPYNVKVEARSNNAIVVANAEGETTHHQAFDVARTKTKRRATGGKLRPKDRTLVNDFISGEQFTKMITGAIRNCARALLPGRHFYFWGGYSNLWGQHDAPFIPPILNDAGLFVSQLLIWHKEWPVLVRKVFLHDHEVCFFGWREGKRHYMNMEYNNISDVWVVKKVTHQNMIHLTEKPLELATRAIRYSSCPGEVVLDVFGGSGSTLIAAEQLERRCYMMEIDPLYCDVIVERWETYTGQQAERIVEQ